MANNSSALSACSISILVSKTQFASSASFSLSSSIKDSTPCSTLSKYCALSMSSINTLYPFEVNEDAAVAP